MFRIETNIPLRKRYHNTGLCKSLVDVATHLGVDRPIIVKGIGENPSGELYRSVGWNGRLQSETFLRGGGGTLDGLRPGTWDVRVEASDGRTWSAAANILPGGEASLDLK